MQKQKKNDLISLELLLEHIDSKPLSSSLVTEADFSHIDGKISVSLGTHSFNDLRARWNSIMRALIASEQILEATSRGE
jgi:hypothetical protein